jgi:aquaglyceroporin related protein
MILMIFVNGTNCQVVLSNRKDIVSFPAGDFQSINFGTAVGAAMGVWIAGGISGGHINPAVTLAFAVWRGFPWRKVPGFIFAQLMGGVAGAALIYANYYHGINLFENGVGVRTLKTAGLFATYAQPYMTNVSCFFSEFLGTAVMLICVMSFGDRRNGPPPAGLAPLAIFFLILGLGCALGVETGYALNPARDLGPRILTSIVGYGSAVYSYRSQYWLWCTVLGPVLGAQAGCVVYDLFLYDGEDSIVNKQAPDSLSQEKKSETCA